MKRNAVWRRIGSLGMSLCLAAGIAAPSLAVNVKDGTYQDGTYEGSAQGYYGLITLSVTMKDGAIQSIDVISHTDTPIYWDDAAAVMDTIIEKQSTDVDTVSGATYSSKGIIGAVESALKKAEGNAVDLSFFASGDGTKENPYTIANADQLRKFASSVDTYSYKGCFVSLSGNIDISGADWNSVGNDNAPFNGTFDGNGYTISGLTMGSADKAYTAPDGETIIGLFSVLGSDAVVRNVSLTDVNMNIYSQQELTIGTLAGKTTAKNSKENRNGSIINNCHVEGNLTVKNTGKNIWAGGLLGYQYCGSVLNCSADVDVYAAETTGENWLEVGGLAGINVWGAIVNCYARGDVTTSLYDHVQGEAEDETGGAAGGLCGLEYGEEHNCYASGNVTALKSIQCMGGLAGSYVKGSKVINSWYNTEAVLTNGDTKDTVKDVSENIGGTAENNQGFDSSDAFRMKAALNRVVNAQTLDLTNYGIQASDLDSWTIRNGNVVHGTAYECSGGNTCPSNRFTDINRDKWYHEAIDAVVANEYMVGQKNNSFAPESNLSRAMLVQILYNAENKPESKKNSAFHDVKEGAWYADAVAWAAQNNIVAGYGKGKFGPNDSVTREQAAQIMYAYAAYKGVDVSGQAALDSYQDAKTVSAWAVSAMRWAVSSNIIVGTSADQLSPRKTATRAEAAQIIIKLMDLIANNE
ncbi:MAG: S-layer homology domain-containing protein [Clostridia bacterium]|nr:S-layer homology domain-containing protein [Clostridia bacterium]